MTITLSILVFLLVLFSFICGSIWGYSAHIRDMKQAIRDEALNRRKL